MLHQWNTKWAFTRKVHIFTHEDNIISSHVKRSPSLWLHNKSRLWKQADLVFHWCLYDKENITYSLMDMNFTFSCSTRYLTCSQHSLVRYRVEHLRIKFTSTLGHVISSILVIIIIKKLSCQPDCFVFGSFVLTGIWRHMYHRWCSWWTHSRPAWAKYPWIGGSFSRML